VSRGSGLLVPGRNCWRLEPAARLAFLIDGEECFAAMRAAMTAAERSILLLGWDVDSRMELVRDDPADGLPAALADFLHALLERRAKLEVRILDWDYAMLYALEREWLPATTFGAGHHPRLWFQLDASHPFGASHHQKVLVIDDAVAFVGGLDLTRSRWDSRRHLPGDPRRRDADGTCYPPFHDVHALVDGAAARALGELARERWRAATGVAPAAVAPGFDPWPPGLSADACDLEVGIARTVPAADGHAGVGEIRTLLHDAIGSARRHIFAESQYFTAETVADALIARLAEADGPEFVSVTAREHCGWLEESTMGVLRARLHGRLREADRHGRHAAYFPRIAGAHGDCLNVHSKVLVIDDELLTIGSANLSNRSLGTDSECNLVIAADGDARVGAAIAGLRNRLLAEHLDTDDARVAAAIAAQGSLVGAIESLRGEGRSLVPVDFHPDPDVDAAVSGNALFDPERPVDPDRLVAQLFPPKLRRPARIRLAIGAAVVVLSCALVGVWLLTPLREWTSVERLVALARTLGASPWTPLVLCAAFVAGGLVAFPVNVLIAVTVIVCGPLRGTFYALAGSLLSAQALYELGHWLGRGALRRFAGEHLDSLRRRLLRRGLLAVIIVRIVPIAPYTVVNLVAGAAHISRRVYLLGTLVGMLPGIVMSALLVDRVLAALRHPGPLTYGLLVVVGVLIVAAIVFLRRHLRRRAGVDG
jgi:phosphatidylserine/phosphatidylglycerophosphate/cardiolipin synthase-like enzyme/uncharacterized membrane protein YdjX (TVP38/TMEM64 family)